MVNLLPVVPAKRSGGEWFVAFAVFLVIVQIDGNTIMSLVLPPLALLWNGIRVERRSGTWAMWAWFALTMIPAFVGMIHHEVPGGRNYFIMMLSAFITALVVFRGGDVVRGGKAIVHGVFAGVATLAAIGVFEVATGFKLLYLRYPNASVISWAQAYPWITTAMYPNYNDFSVALVLLALFIWSRFLLKPSKVGVQVLRVVVVAGLAAWIFAMGSRGALLGLLLGLVVLAVLSERRRDIRSIPAWAITVGLAVGGLGALVMWQSTFVQDNDTAARGVILQRLWGLISQDPMNAWFGLGAPEVVDRLSQQYLGGLLVNPHNLIAETMLSGGIPAVFGYLICWGFVVWLALANRTMPTWQAMGAVSATVVMPLLGVTPSVILNYLYPQYLMVAAVALTAFRPDGASSPEPAHQAPQQLPTTPDHQHQQQ